ncbi:MAG: methylenetetrahydrofolate reductase C-terminal domain-containing protein, partial [Halanaerobiales bacterium]
MIVGSQKDIQEIIEMLESEDFDKLLIAGCGTCVTVSMAGGEREVNALAEILRGYYEDIDIETTTVKRQCDFEFLDEMEEEIDRNDLILSLACGVGVQHITERYPKKIVLPGLNTTFYGASIDAGVLAERCIGCGECVLDEYFGICPVARCSKSLLNG